MRANRTGLDEIERWANANNVKIMNIGDSVMARRIIDGVREGRNVLDALEDMGALGSREAQRIPLSNLLRIFVMAERITGHTELIGLIATPIRHSMSPTMHNEAFAHLGLDYVYLGF